MKRLKEWGIAPSSAYDFHIEGYCEVTGEFLTTADVHTRLSRTRIVCVDGRSYELVGPFDRVSGMEGNLPARILDEFMHGVPRNWRQVILGWSEQEQQVNGQDRRESRGTSKHRDRPVQRCCAAKGLKTMQRDNVFNFQPQRRHNHTSSASSSPPAKQKSPAKSSIYAPHLQLKEARVIVERLPTAILEKVSGESARRLSSGTRRASWAGRTRNQSPSSQVLFSGEGRQKVPKKLRAHVGTPLRGSSCPATRHRTLDVSRRRTDEVCTRSGQARVQHTLRSTKQRMQATRNVNALVTASTCETRVRRHSALASTGKRTAVLKPARAATLPVAKTALSALVTTKHRKKCSHQELKKSAKQKGKPKLDVSQKSSRGKQVHSVDRPEKGHEECRSSTSMRTRISHYPTRKNSKLEVNGKSPCTWPDKQKSSLHSSRHSACDMKREGIQLPSRQHKGNASVEECTPIITSKQYCLRSSIKASNKVLTPAGQKPDQISSLSEHQNKAAIKNRSLPGGYKCKHAENECTRMRSRRCLLRNNTMYEGKRGAMSVNASPDKRKQGLDSAQTAENDEQLTDVPHRGHTSSVNVLTKRKATASLRQCTSTVMQQCPSCTAVRTDSTGTTPVERKLPRRKSPGSQKDPTRKSSPHSQVQKGRHYSTRSSALAICKLAPNSLHGLPTKHELSLDASQSTAGGKQQTGSADSSSTLSKSVIAKQQIANKNEMLHSSSTMRTCHTSSAKSNTICTRYVSNKSKRELSKSSSKLLNEVSKQVVVPLKTQRTALPKKRAATSSPYAPQKSFENVNEAKAASYSNPKIDDTKSVSGKRKPHTRSSGHKENAANQRSAPKRKRSVTSSPGLLPRRKTSRGTSLTKVVAKVTPCPLSSSVTTGKQKSSQDSTVHKEGVGQEDICPKNQGVSSIKPSDTFLPAILPTKAASEDVHEAHVENLDAEKHNNIKGSKRATQPKKQASLIIYSNNSDAGCCSPYNAEVASSFKSFAHTENQRTPRLGVPGALKNSGSEQAEPIVKPQPCKPVCNAGPSNGDPKHKASESTEALLAITARKGTLKRKAQIKKLVDALAAKEACDDIYQSQTLAGNIPGEFFATQKWDELSDFDPSRMATPVPNSPHLSPGKSQFSFSSSDSPSPERRVSAVAIMQSLRKRDNVANLKPSTPKSRYMKSQNVEKVLQGLRKLESKLEKEKLKENCEDSIEEEEDTDYESSQDELLLLH